MRIGFDVDGVLADFNRGFATLLSRTSGRRLATADFVPSVWDWPEHLGYTKDEVDWAWREVERGGFWLKLEPTRHLDAVQMLWDHGDDVYFITDRRGVGAKRETEQWLVRHLALAYPTVLISSMKGALCSALNLDVYVDDRLGNVADVRQRAPLTRVYLLDAPYNQSQVYDQYRVKGLREVVACCQLPS